MRLNTTQAVDTYKDTLYRVAFNICRSKADAEDAVQDCFIKYHTGNMEYESEAHLKAWLLRVTINLSKNIVSSLWHRSRENWEEVMAEVPFEQPEDRGVFAAVMSLPGRYRTVIHLFYYEGYAVEEIAELLNLSPGTVKSQLCRGRRLLKAKLQEEWENE